MAAVSYAPSAARRRHPFTELPELCSSSGGSLPLLAEPGEERVGTPDGRPVPAGGCNPRLSPTKSGRVAAPSASPSPSASARATPALPHDRGLAGGPHTHTHTHAHTHTHTQPAGAASLPGARGRRGPAQDDVAEMLAGLSLVTPQVPAMFPGMARAPGAPKAKVKTYRRTGDEGESSSAGSPRGPAAGLSDARARRQLPLPPGAARQPPREAAANENGLHSARRNLDFEGV